MPVLPISPARPAPARSTPSSPATPGRHRPTPTGRRPARSPTATATAATQSTSGGRLDEDGTVRFEVVNLTRPRGLLRLAGPVVHPLDDRLVRRYLRGMQGQVAGAA